MLQEKIPVHTFCFKLIHCIELTLVVFMLSFQLIHCIDSHCTHVIISTNSLKGNFVIFITDRKATTSI